MMVSESPSIRLVNSVELKAIFTVESNEILVVSESSSMGERSKNDKKWEKFDGEVQLKVNSILSMVGTDVGIVPLTSVEQHHAPHGYSDSQSAANNAYRSGSPGSFSKA